MREGEQAAHKKSRAKYDDVRPVLDLDTTNVPGHLIRETGPESANVAKWKQDWPAGQSEESRTLMSTYAPGTGDARSKVKRKMSLAAEGAVKADVLQEDELGVAELTKLAKQVHQSQKDRRTKSRLSKRSDRIVSFETFKKELLANPENHKMAGEYRKNLYLGRQWFARRVLAAVKDNLISSITEEVEELCEAAERKREKERVNEKEEGTKGKGIVYTGSREGKCCP